MMKRLRRIHSQRRGKQRTLPCLVCKSEDQAARDVLQSVPCRQQRVVVPPEVPQDMRNSVEDMEISQLQVKRKVRKVQGVSLDTDKRELQRWARNSVEYSVRDKLVEAIDALINEVGALWTESGGEQMIEIVSGWSLGWRPGFASDFCENKQYGPHEGESWDLSKNSDVKELLEMIAFERPMIVTGSPPCAAFSQFQNVSCYPEREKWQATKLLHVAMDVYEEQSRAGRYFLHEHPFGASSWADPRVTALQTVFSLCHHQCVVSTRRSKQRTVREMSTSLCANQPSG